MTKKFNYDTLTIDAIEFYKESDEFTGEVILNSNLVKEYLKAKEDFEALLAHLLTLIEEEENRVYK